MYKITITTKFALLIYDFHPKTEVKLLNYLGSSISHKIYTNRSLYTDGARRPFLTKTKIDIIHLNTQWYSFDIIPSSDEIKTFSKIAWELRNKLPKQFSLLFKIPCDSRTIFTKREHSIYVEKWVLNILKHRKKQPATIKNNKNSEEEAINEWITFISTPMYS